MIGMIKATQEDLLYLSSTFSRMHKRKFGKGPETCYVFSKGARLYIYIRNFITPAEEVLIDTNKIDLATTFRLNVIQAVNEEFVPEVSKLFGMNFDCFYYDWNYDTNTGVLLFENESSKNEAKLDVLFENDLYNLIVHVSSRLHKTPDSLKIVKFTQNICAVEAEGVLVEFEKVLYEKDMVDLLLHHSRDIKRGYMKHKQLFEEVFNRVIEDIFILCDYENNRKYLIFNFNKDYS
jgi:uncharacterized protein YbcI